MDPIEKDGVIYLEVDASECKPKPAEGLALKGLQAMLEKIRQYAPDEYAAIMKQREEFKKQNNPPKTGDEHGPNEG